MDQSKRLEKIRRLEEELTFASPAKAAKITKRLVRLKTS
jgi:hypothetical protein